ncbi:MAG: hypothetical protein NT043_05175 [Candidatus Bathyarchaeota archaeon]|nr:hypothetical protein [Candidatus Bathyarchaeota archaeon]
MSEDEVKENQPVENQDEPIADEKSQETRLQSNSSYQETPCFPQASTSEQE